MKGLNIKKVAAIGIGAALIGSALAPVVSANQVPGGLSGLDRSDIVSATGQPVVDVVVGSNAAVSDVVWAGNIAARVAQLATTSVAGGAGEVTGATVDVTVGGQTQVSGAGVLREAEANFSAAELTNILVGDSRMPTLVNNSSAKLRLDNLDVTTTVKEELVGSMDARFQSTVGSNQYAVGEMIGNVSAGALQYRVSFGTDMNLAELPANGMDNSSRWNVQVPWLGKVYTVDGSTSDSLIMYADTTPQRLYPMETIMVPGAGNYTGKQLTLELETIYVTLDTGDSFNAVWNLRDGQTLIDQKEITGVNYDLRDSFGSTVMADSAHVTNVARDVVANTHYASVRTGEERIELKHNRGYPWNNDATEANRAQWKVVYYSGSSVVNPANSTFNAIVLENQWAYTRTSGTETESSNTKYALRVGEEVVLPNDFAKFSFNGFRDEKVSEIHIGDVSGIENGGISYADLRGNRVHVPFYKTFGLENETATEVLINDRVYTFWRNSDANVSYIKGSQGNVDTMPTTWTTVGVNSTNVVDANIYQLMADRIMLDLGAENELGATIDTNYYFVYQPSTSEAALVLADQTFNIANDGDSAIPNLTFQTTDVNGTQVQYYFPNAVDFVNGVLGRNWSDYRDIYMAAGLNYIDNAGESTELLIRTTGETGKVWDYESIKNEDFVSGPTYDAEYDGRRIRNDSSSFLMRLYTQDGSSIESDNSKFILMVPEKRMPVQAYLGSSDTTTTIVGGGKITNLGVGETGTASGVSVTVDAVSGTAEGADGVALVRTGDIVKADNAQGIKGKRIIVGGFVVNSVARNVEVANGNTLEDLLVSSGDYVAALLTSGNVVVAGYTAADTGSAARELINALDALI